MNHTSGPWAAAARQGDDWESVVYVPGTPNEICQCFHSSLSLVGKENCEANARLIAAAPEMYEALVKLHQIIDFEEPVSQTGRLGYVDDPAAINEAMRLACAAISKAEGK